jgi:hypothetical protein
MVSVLKADAVVNVIAQWKPDLSKASRVSTAILQAAGAELQQVRKQIKCCNVICFDI